MENENLPNLNSFSSALPSAQSSRKKEPVIVNFATDSWMISGEVWSYYENGVFIYDMANVTFINNTGMAKILELLKCLLKEGNEVRFMNVKNEIKQKIKSLGLEHILICI